MSKSDWLVIGLKLIGVWFAIHGIATTVSGLVSLTYKDLPTQVSLQWVGYSLPYLVIGFLCTRQTDWCLKLIDPLPAVPPEPEE